MRMKSRVYFRDIRDTGFGEFRDRVPEPFTELCRAVAKDLTKQLGVPIAIEIWGRDMEKDFYIDGSVKIGTFTPARIYHNYYGLSQRPLIRAHWETGVEWVGYLNSGTHTTREQIVKTVLDCIKNAGHWWLICTIKQVLRDCGMKVALPENMEEAD